MADCVENDSNRNASQFGDVVLIGVGYIKNIKGSRLTDLDHLSLRNPIYVHRYSSACGRCFVCFGLGPCTLTGSKTKHTQHLPQADE